MMNNCINLLLSHCILRVSLFYIGLCCSCIVLANTEAVRGYKIELIDPASLKLSAPELPNTENYNEDTARARLKTITEKAIVKPQVLEVRRMFKEPTLGDFTAGERAREWAKRQKTHPKAIFLKSGIFRPKDIARALKGSEYFKVQSNDSYLVRLPLVIEQDAVLLLEGNSHRKQTLRFSQEKGAFLVVDGFFFSFHAELSGWSENKSDYAYYQRASDFRPFFVSWGGSSIYLIESTVKSFGYSASKSYGVTVTQYSEEDNRSLHRASPFAWIINSKFEDMYFGFYCWEADGLVILGNEYINNVVYGIDPHDRSERLIITDNTVYGTREKHGIIISREVAHSWIYNNRSYENKLSGIVLDRNSSNNVVAANSVHHNGGDGITVYESSGNLFWENKIYANRKHGIRIRNSSDVRLYSNLVMANQQKGIFAYVKDLSDSSRNFDMDPYAKEVTLIVHGGELAFNTGGEISMSQPLSIELFGVVMRFPAKKKGIRMDGVLTPHFHYILDVMNQRNQAVYLQPNIANPG